MSKLLLGWDSIYKRGKVEQELRIINSFTQSVPLVLITNAAGLG